MTHGPRAGDKGMRERGREQNLQLLVGLKLLHHSTFPFALFSQNMRLSL